MTCGSFEAAMDEQQRRVERFDRYAKIGGAVILAGVAVVVAVLVFGR